MMYDQIEYCGNCEHFAKCKELATDGRLHNCKAKEEKRTMKNVVKDFLLGFGFLCFLLSISLLAALLRG